MKKYIIQIYMSLAEPACGTGVWWVGLRIRVSVTVDVCFDVLAVAFWNLRRVVVERLLTHVAPHQRRLACNDIVPLPYYAQA
jgi:hypothetical protein